MANELTPWQPDFWAAASLVTLQNNLVLAPLVHRDFEDEVAIKGKTVNTRKPRKFTANTKTSGSNVTKQDAKADNLPITLDKHQEVTFVVEDVTRAMALKTLFDSHLVPAVQALAQKVDKDLYDSMALYFPYTAGAVGSAATVPGTLTSINKKANEKQWPYGGRHFVVGPTVEQIFLNSTQFTSTDYTGDGGEALRNASMGRKWNLNLFQDQNVEGTFAQADITTGYLIDGAVAAGASTITVDTGIGAVAAGAKISVAGEEYAVTAVAGAVWTISPKARVAIADNAAITVIGDAATYTRLPAFQKEALGLINRPLPLPEKEFGVMASVVNDGSLAIRAIVSYDANMLAIQVTLDILYGIAPFDVDRGLLLVY